MSPELAAAAAFAIAAAMTFLVTPLAIAIANRTGFYDLPAGYKGHKRPTPYLGGSAIVVGILAAVVLVRGAASFHWLIIIAAVAIWAVGTLDDRINLSISLRTLVEVGIAAALWATGRGWGVFHFAPADLALTIVWVVGVMNAFNLMDNMDGAAATTAAVSATGAGALALISGDAVLASLSFAVAGACAGFLPRNLARPARIFMGDGGSLLIGLLVARVTMAAVSPGYLGPTGVIIAGLLVALAIFDTSLVTISRTRAGRSVLEGGRDHLTHRLATRLRSPRRVALTLAGAQLMLCGITVAATQAGVAWVLLAGGLSLALGVAMIWQLERPAWVPPPVAESPATVASPAAAAIDAGALSGASAVSR